MSSTQLLVHLLLSCDSAPRDFAADGLGGPGLASGSEPLAPEQRRSSLALIAADHRRFDPVGPGQFAARFGRGLAAELTSEGLLASAAGDTIGLASRAYGGLEIGVSEPREGGCALGADTIGAACVRQVELDHGPLTEWWVSRANGLEHGWTLHEGPGAEPTRITVHITHGALLSVDEDGQGAWLEGSSGGLWRYDELVAWDATGAATPVWLEAEDGDLVVHVDTASVVWPVTVDPTLGAGGHGEDKLTASDGAAEDLFGFSVAGAGDVDGDGYHDLVIGAPFNNDCGSAYVYYGSSAGVDTSTEGKLTASDGAADDRFGSSVAGVGDVNGDGYDDLVIGAYGGDEHGTASGSAYVYHGSSAGIDTSTEYKLTASDSSEGDYFGFSVAGAGDVNGDGYDDLVIGAFYDEDLGPLSGSAYVYYGSSAGIDTSTENKLTASDGKGGGNFGISVAGAGDVDGDGYDDLVIGADVHDDSWFFRDAAYVYYGSSAGIDTSTEDKLITSDGEEWDYFGRNVAAAGDVNGDGYGDLVIGAFGDDDSGRGYDRGSAYVFFGSSVGIDASTEDKITASDGEAYDYFGRSVAGAGDIDGDGYDDLVIGALGDDDSEYNGGSAYVYYGSSAGIDTSAEYKLTASDSEAWDYFGFSVSGAGDVNGDGYDNVVIGAQAGSGIGSAYVYPGGSAGCHGDDDDSDGFCDDTDCDDTDASIHPVAIEVVGDELDQNCDGTEICHADADDDGYTDGATTVASSDIDCSDSGEGSSTDPTGDCDDTDSALNPSATELCDSADNDCDGTVDEDDAADASTWYVDGDGDGYGDPALTSTACDHPTGTVSDDTDCDDTDPDAWPGAPEVEDDGIDQDCDGEDAVSPDEGDSGEFDGSDDSGDGEGGKEVCGGCASTAHPGPGAGLLLALVALVDLRRRAASSSWVRG